MILSYDKERTANKLLEELISINEHLCSKEELRLIKEFTYHGEESLALDEFCAMWEVTKKPKLDEKSKKIIRQLFELLDIEENKILDTNISKILQE